jgi:hypothetical protein
MSRTVFAMRLFCRLGAPSYGRPGRGSRKARRCSTGLSTPFGAAHPFDSGMAVHNRNWSNTMQKTTCKTGVAACRNLFGEHPEDVISPINSAAEALFWLEELFLTIAREALDERNGYRIKHLAEMGAYLASDVGNYAGYQHETMIDRLRNAGIVPAEGVAA